ncbi:MAG: endonuclease/exonuclease/phosphatase family protein [Planctomycetota bacterium]|nr:endonuclease/exonuclease/phosphatase family protein [Planctomycetota bacterium]
MRFTSPTALTRLSCLLLVVSPLLPCVAGHADEGDRLRVLVWNAWRGGNEVESGPEKVLAVIREAAPDLVLMQESYDIDGDRPTLGRWIAEELGWHVHQAESPHLCVLTPMKIDATFFHDPWHGLGVRVTDEAKRSFVAWSIWLDYRAYITYELRDQPELTDAELLAAEDVRSTRVQEATALLAHLEEAGQLELDVPLLVGGDWNTPSHLDWTVDTTRVYRHRRALPLPVSTLMEQKGFIDTFRVVHPNPVQRPGLTWSPMFRVNSEGKPQGFERIDRLYVKNPADGAWTLAPLASHVLPVVWEPDSIPTEKRTFPSDHGAVVIDLAWVRSAD